jgi:hypothetical protein
MLFLKKRKLQVLLLKSQNKNLKETSSWKLTQTTRKIIIYITLVPISELKKT